MNAVRSILSDLVEKRLWPVALVLVVALIATPVVLAGGDVEPVADPVTPDATDPTAAPAPLATASKVSLDATPIDRTHRPGAVRDPFEPFAAASSGTSTTTTTSGATTTGSTVATGSTTPSTGSAGTSTTPASTTPSSTTPSGTSSGGTAPSGSTPSPASALAPFSVTVRFGRTVNPPRVIEDLPRLAALPDADHPFVVYLGVLFEGQTAAFLLTQDVAVSGDGKCRPSRSACKSIELEPGETATLDISYRGEVIQYALELVSARPAEVDSRAELQAAARRHSDAGADLLRAAHVAGNENFDGTDRYRWVPRLGLVWRIPDVAFAALATADDDTAAGILIGKPIWHYGISG